MLAALAIVVAESLLARPCSNYNWQISATSRRSLLTVSAKVAERPRYEGMKIDIRRLERGTTLATAALLAAVGAFLVTSPWHPKVGDSHDGLMAVLPGVLLLLFAPIIYAIGGFLSRRGSWGLKVQIAVSVLVVVTVATLGVG